MKLFGLLAQRFPHYDPGQGWEVELREGAKVEDLLTRLEVSQKEGAVVTIDGVVQKAEASLKDGAEVYVFHMVTGG